MSFSHLLNNRYDVDGNQMRLILLHYYFDRFFTPKVLATMDKKEYGDTGIKNDEIISNGPDRNIKDKIKRMWD